jgi:hypothetical protein
MNFQIINQLKINTKYRTAILFFVVFLIMFFPIKYYEKFFKLNELKFDSLVFIYNDNYPEALDSTNVFFKASLFNHNVNAVQENNVLKIFKGMLKQKKGYFKVFYGINTVHINQGDSTRILKLNRELKTKRTDILFLNDSITFIVGRRKYDSLAFINRSFYYNIYTRKFQ